MSSVHSIVRFVQWRQENDVLQGPYEVYVNYTRIEHKISKKHTAGSAKNDIPIMAHEAAINLPAHVIGTASPYPTVHRVIWKKNNRVNCKHTNSILITHTRMHTTEVAAAINDGAKQTGPLTFWY
jgi:hypothetical protein